MTLAELIMTRVSHDLAGICGALYNTAELLEIDPTFAGESGGVIKNSTKALTDRLKFFRALFGLDGAMFDNQIVLAYLKTLSADFSLTGMISNRAQLAGIMICTDTMIRGGQIQVSENKIIGNGFIRADEQLGQALIGTLENIGPKMAPAAWLSNWAKCHGSSIHLNVQEDQIVLSFL